MSPTDEILIKMPAIEGEIRTINKCNDCGKLFGRRFVPFGLSLGLTVNACLCQLTSHRPSVIIMECNP